MSQLDLLEEICHLRFTATERDLLNCWQTYRVSDVTHRLATEAGRAIYAEAIAFGDQKGSRTFYPQSLATLAVQSLVNGYRSGPVPSGLTCEQVRDFGLLLPLELPVLDLLEFENETYWKRVVKAKTKRLIDFLKHERDSNSYWKSLGMELLVAEALEREKPEYWFEGILEDILIKTAPYIFELVISELTPLENIETAEGYEEYKVYDVPPELCSHGSLEILKHLANLTSLSLVFGLNDVLKGYERRFFQFSLEDMENLCKALPKLLVLENFTLVRSKMSPEKLKALLEQLALVKLKTLELSYCYLQEETGILLGRYISKCPGTLKSINLSGNFLDGNQIENFSYGINVYQGVLDKLDLSHNPIGEAGVLMLGGAIKNTEHVRELAVTGCELGPQGAFRVVQLLGFHRPLKVLHMNGTPLGKTGGKKLIEVLKQNWFVEVVNCKQCNLKISHEQRVQSILRRNRKFLLARKNSASANASATGEPEQSDNFQNAIIKQAVDIDYCFIPARSSHFGGPWESAVKSFKNQDTAQDTAIASLRKIVYYKFHMILTQIEAILKSRPLTPLGNDSDDFEAQTPRYFFYSVLCRKAYS
ncbi:uncharacterized protein LOC128736789 [Sabethes cyaneus]|uniref:uncharacterized protein LOC128736789 n=1 Tax=Sabethes cyaneus TaxID=53552 RepID=UPI00237EC8A0|nr:uncharacterized protein LOC128736789 [Sabethes cyaneus]